MDLLTYTEAETGGYKEVIAQVRCRCGLLFDEVCWPGFFLLLAYTRLPLGDW